jgi:tRNA/tmRNA/rRNA uracil-C5-methylase (TrmA/RlmC/RlmD family)
VTAGEAGAPRRGAGKTGNGSTGNGATGRGSTGDGSAGRGTTGDGRTGRGSTGKGSTGKGGTGSGSGAVRRRAAYRDRRPARAGGPWQGSELEVEVGPVAHGGHCVARHEGRVVFVRHALPGERVRVRITEDGGGSYCRADAVAVLRASPDRVRPPCEYAGPGGCGGCDWQHAAVPAQRELKAAVVREALARLGGLPDVPVTVQPLPGGPLGWRTRLQFAVDGAGRLGLRRHRSHEIELIDSCPLATAEVNAVDAPARLWPDAEVVEVVAATGGDTAVRQTPRGRGAPRLAGPAVLTERAAGRDWQVAAGGFWQVHPQAAATLAACVVDLLRPAAGEAVLDLYAGAGLFAGVLAGHVGITGRVLAVESDPAAVADARANLAGHPWVSVHHGRVENLLAADPPRFPRPDLVVLDPPRAGAGPATLLAACALRPRAVAYLACDPAALARDLKAATGHGYRLADLRAFDLFPMTHHVECVALLEPAQSPGGPDA